MPDFYERMRQEAANRNLTVSSLPPLRPRGTLFKILDYLDRPRATVSEAVQAAMAGEDVGAAALRGWRGRPKYGTLGEAAFPKAAEPGFQPEDIPAFAIDMLTDPTLWVGPGVVKAVGKPLAKGALALGAKALPKEVSRLRPLTGPFGAAIRELPRRARVKMIKGELDELGMTAEEAYGRVWKLTTKENRDKLRAFTDPSEVVKRVEDVPDEGLNVLQEAIRDLQANIRPDAQTSINSLMQSAAQRWAPAAAFLRTFNGTIGRRYADGYKTALYNTDRRAAQWVRRLREYQNLPGARKETNRIASSEAVERIRPPATKEVAAMSDNMDRMLRDFFEEATDPMHNDQFGQGLMVYNYKTGEATPLAKHFVKHYFPRRSPDEAFSNKGHKILRRKMQEWNWSEEKITNEINKLKSIQPKKVGHVEFARLDDMDLYEKDPLKVLPKYFHDVIWRQELGKQFGMNNQVLDAYTAELITRGVDENWLQRLSTGIIGRNPYYDAIDSLTRKLGTFQAISKLGFATSVANASQMTNQAIRSGFGNFARSSARYLGEKAGVTEKTNYDLLALSRRAWGDIAATAGHQPTGMIGRLGDMYIRGIGFPLTERVGRHIGALGGDLEVVNLARKIRQFGIKSKERGRLLSEIGRKYGVADNMIGPGGELSRDIVERAAWDAARKTMHAFDIMELPLAWRDPTWKMILQFKSFIYKQSEFMFNEVAMPGIQWFATNGAKGDVKPLLRAMITVPPMAELVTHGRDIVKSVPTRVVEMSKNYVAGDPLSKTKWDYKDPFWEDPDPAWRVLSDSIYMGLFGIVGDMYESARMGRLADWLAGPTIGDVVDIGEAVARGNLKGLGKVGTQMIPGALGIPYGANLLEAGGSFYDRMMREAARRRLQ